MKNDPDECRVTYEALESTVKDRITSAFKAECTKRELAFNDLFADLSLLRHAVKNILGVYLGYLKKFQFIQREALRAYIVQWTSGRVTYCNDVPFHFPLCADAIDYIERELLPKSAV